MSVIPLWSRRQLRAGSLFLVFSMMLFIGRTDAARCEELWEVLAPLAGPGRAASPSGAFRKADDLKGLLSSFVYRRDFEPDLDRSLTVIINGFDTFDLRDLYNHPEVAWRDVEGKEERFFLFQGARRGDRYVLGLVEEAGGAAHLGDMSARLALSKLQHEEYGEVFLFSFDPEINLGPLGLAESLAMTERFLSLFEIDAGEESIEKSVRDRFSRGAPETVALLSRFIDAERFGVKATGPAGEAISAVDLRLSVDERALGEAYPNLRRAYRKIVKPIRLRFRISDFAGGRFADIIWRDGGLEFRAIVRNGRLYRSDPEWRSVTGPAVSIAGVSAGRHQLEFDFSVAALGIRAGIKEMVFHVNLERDGEEGMYHSRLESTPAMAMPFALRPLARLILGDFLKALRYGNHGSGIDYLARYSRLDSRGGGSGNLQRIAFRLPLKNSRILSLLLRMGRSLRGSADEAARKEYGELLAAIGESLGRDYEAARLRAVEKGAWR